jgi:hypothetical protein
MLALAVSLIAWSVPQDSPRPRVLTTPHGWPVEVRGEAAAGSGAVFPAPSGNAAAGREAHEPAALPGGRLSADRALPVAAFQHNARANPSPLVPVFRAVGTPADAAALRGVRVTLRSTLYDHRGAVLGERTFVHEADLGDPARDRLLLPGDTVYGRDGAAVFALYRGLHFPTLENEARDDLACLGSMLRVPWVFADPARYSVLPREELLWNGRPMSRFRITTCSAPDTSLATDEFELWCDPDTCEPRLLLTKPADPAARPTRVRLLEFATVGNVRVPMRRVIESAEGSRVQEVELSEFAPEQKFAARHFAAPAR